MPEKIELVQRVDLIKELCKGKRVLHLGCTNWPYTRESIDAGTFLHAELREIASELYGFDFDPEGIDYLKALGYENLYVADLEKLEDVELSDSFEVIIAGEMIEHLNNPGLFLKGIQRFMDSNSELVITTVNAYSALRFVLYALRGKGGVNEPVHPDHVYYFSYKTLKLLIERSGLKVGEVYFYDIGTEHRPHSPWHYRFANDVAVTLSKQLADGVIARCALP